MTEHQPQHRVDRDPAGQPAQGPPTPDPPAPGLITPAAAAAEGGEAACWAHLVCYDCGSMVTEGHRPGCPSAPPAGAVPETP
jgi:hypothetical protein